MNCFRTSRNVFQTGLALLAFAGAMASASAAPASLPWANASPGLLAIGSDPRGWGAPAFVAPANTAAAFVEGGQLNTPGPVGCANNGYTFNWIPDTSGTQCGFASGGYSVYTAWDGTWLWVGAVVNDTTDFTSSPGTVGANEAPSPSRRDNVEFRIGSPAKNYVASVCPGGIPPASSDLFLVGAYRDANNAIGQPAGYPEVGDRWRTTENIDWNRWTVNAPSGDTSRYIVGVRVRLATLGVALGDVRINMVAKNQTITGSNDDANRVWLSGDKSVVATPGDLSCAGSNFRRQFQLSDNWARLDSVASAQLAASAVPLPDWRWIAVLVAVFAYAGMHGRRSVK